MSPTWRTGNAEDDSRETRGWLLGHFIDAGDIRSTDALEVKWGVHPPGDERATWVTDDGRTALVVLVEGGPFTVALTGGTAELRRLGDYVIYGPGIDHTWRAVEHSVVLTVRWPSMS